MSATNIKVFATHCGRGHPWTPENTYLKYVGGKLRQRSCRACWKERNREAADNRKAVESTTLDPKALRRLREAYADGVTKADLCGRFQLSDAQLTQHLESA